MRLPPVVLASASPRRRRLLEKLGLPVEVRPSRVDESMETAAVAERVLALARRKVDAVAADTADGYLLAADTLGVLDGDVLGKPRGERDALQMLWRLSGREHEVLTGVVVLRLDAGAVEQRAETVVTTRVRFRSVRLGEIDAYVRTGEYEGKAGAYAIQGLGRSLVARVDGSYTNVVGLPLGATVSLLHEVGYPVPPVDVAALDRDPEAAAEEAP